MGRVKTIQIDMDDTCADFLGSPLLGRNPDGTVDISPMYEPGFFLNLKPVEGALRGVRALIKMGFDVQFLTQPVAESPHCYQEKVQWVGMWFPELVKKINMTQDKGLVRGDYLIDDNAEKWAAKFEAGGGTFVHFRYHEHEHEFEWSLIVKLFQGIKPEAKDGV